MFQATTVANTILRKASEDDAEVTCLKLQGILYFLASYYAKITNKKLFSENFETWTHGPVLPSIYRKFGSYGAEPIKGYAKDAAGVAEFVDLQDNKTFRTVLDNVYDATIGHTDTHLRQVTRNAKSAWDIANKTKSSTLDWMDVKNDTSYYMALPSLVVALRTVYITPKD